MLTPSCPTASTDHPAEAVADPRVIDFDDMPHQPSSVPFPMVILQLSPG